jgi:hypothetical protein
LRGVLKMRKSEKEIKENKEHWQNLIPKEEFKVVDINKVKLVEETHLSSRVSIFNIKGYRNKELYPIAVRENDKGEYELVAGLRSFIIAKLLSLNVQAYITDLDRKTFKEKYSLPI